MGSSTLFIEPGSPWQSAYVESFNGKLSDELLDLEEFTSLREARHLAATWRNEYNHVRPHSSLDYRTPAEFAATCAASHNAWTRFLEPVTDAEQGALTTSPDNMIRSIRFSRRALIVCGSVLRSRLTAVLALALAACNSTPPRLERVDQVLLSLAYQVKQLDCLMDHITDASEQTPESAAWLGEDSASQGKLKVTFNIETHRSSSGGLTGSAGLPAGVELVGTTSTNRGTEVELTINIEEMPTVAEMWCILVKNAGYSPDEIEDFITEMRDSGGKCPSAEDVEAVLARDMR